MCLIITMCPIVHPIQGFALQQLLVFPPLPMRQLDRPLLVPLRRFDRLLLEQVVLSLFLLILDLRLFDQPLLELFFQLQLRLFDQFHSVLPERVCLLPPKLVVQPPLLQLLLQPTVALQRL